MHSSGGYMLMRWVKYDHQEVPISMDTYSIHGCGRSMGTMQHLPYLPANIMSLLTHRHMRLIPRRKEKGALPVLCGSELVS